MHLVVQGTSTFYFNTHGRIGVTLFIAGIVASGIFAWLFYLGLAGNAAATYAEPKDVSGFGIMAGICAMASAVGFALMLVGRDLDHKVTVYRTSGSDAVTNPPA